MKFHSAVHILCMVPVVTVSPRWGGGSDRYHRADRNWTGTVLVLMGCFALYFHRYDHTQQNSGICSIKD